MKKLLISILLMSGIAFADGVVQLQDLTTGTDEQKLILGVPTMQQFNARTGSSGSLVVSNLTVTGSAILPAPLYFGDIYTGNLYASNSIYVGGVEVATVDSIIYTVTNPVVQTVAAGTSSNVIAGGAVKDALAGKASLIDSNSFGSSIHVLLWGQSNAKGMGSSTELLDSELLTGVTNAWINEWRDGVDFAPTNLFKVPGRDFGAELSGIRALQKLTGKPVYITKVTYGGAPIGLWTKVPSYGNTNTYYTNIGIQVAQTLAAYTNAGAIDLMWQSQGESDADSTFESTNYNASLTLLVGSLEADGVIPTNCPIIMGGFTKAVEDGYHDQYTNGAIVMAQKDLFIATRGNAWRFSSRDLEAQTTNSVHFNENGLLQYGEQFAAESMRALNKVDNDSLSAREISGHKFQAQTTRTKELYIGGVDSAVYVDERVNDITTPALASNLESALAHVHPVISYLGTNYTRPLPLTAEFYKSNYSGSDTWLDAAYITTSNANGTVWLDASAVNTNIWAQTNGVAAYPSIVDATNSYYFSFTESASNRLYCSIPVARFGDQTNAFTLKTSIFIDSVQTNKVICSSRIDANRTMGLWLSGSQNLQFTMRRTNYFSIASAISTGVWHDVVATWTPSNATMSLTVDGIAGTASGSAISFSGTTLSIGSGTAAVTNSAGFKMKHFILDIQ